MTNGQVIDLYTLALVPHTLTVNAMDKADNTSSVSVAFNVSATVTGLKNGVTRFYNEGKIDNRGIYNALMAKLAANQLQAFINQVRAQSGKHITRAAAELLIADAQWILDHPPITQ